VAGVPGEVVTTRDRSRAPTTDAQHAALADLRRKIQAAAPGAEEGSSYGLAAFKIDGRTLVCIGATREHCALYPMSGEIVARLAPALKRYHTSKGTIRFTPEAPLSAALVKRVVRARLEEMGAVGATRARRTSSRGRRTR